MARALTVMMRPQTHWTEALICWLVSTAGCGPASPSHCRLSLQTGPCSHPSGQSLAWGAASRNISFAWHHWRTCVHRPGKRSPLPRAVCTPGSPFRTAASWCSKPGMEMLRRRREEDHLGAAGGSASRAYAQGLHSQTHGPCFFCGSGNWRVDGALCVHVGPLQRRVNNTVYIGWIGLLIPMFSSSYTSQPPSLKPIAVWRLKWHTLTYCCIVFCHPCHQTQNPNAPWHLCCLVLDKWGLKSCPFSAGLYKGSCWRETGGGSVWQHGCTAWTTMLTCRGHHPQ